MGGGFGSAAAIADELYRDVKAQDVPATVERLLAAYLAHRIGTETFADFTRRTGAEALKRLVDAELVA